MVRSALALSVGVVPLLELSVIEPDRVTPPPSAIAETGERSIERAPEIVPFTAVTVPVKDGVIPKNVIPVWVAAMVTVQSAASL